MAGGGQVGGQGGPIKRGAWMFIAACICVAIWQGAFTDPKGFFEGLKAKSADLQQLVTDLVSDVKSGTVPSIPLGGSGGTSTGGATSGGGTAQATSSLNTLTVTADQSVSYSRDDWRHWDNVGSSCWNVREEVLYRDAQPGTVTLLDRDKHVTADKTKACYVEGGTWNDPYTGQTFTNPDDLDVDHVVPLGAASRSGGQAWSTAKKEAYANDLQDPKHLRAVSASANRSKGDQTPETWKPGNRADWCDYATSWVGVKHRWDLTITAGEKAAVQQMLATC